MTDSNMLKMYIKKSGYKVCYIAERLGITYQGLLNKINNKSEFKQSEIVELTRLLSIDSESKEKIFFTESVDKISTP